MAALPRQKCLVCGKSFQPKSKNAKYDRAACRIRASRQKKEREEKLKTLNGELEKLRRYFPTAAKLVEEMTVKFGEECGRMAIRACSEAARDFQTMYSGKK